MYKIVQAYTVSFHKVDTSNISLISDPLHISFIRNMVSYMVAVVNGYKRQLGKNSHNDQLILLKWLLSINYHSNYSCQLIRSLFRESKC